MIFVEEHVLLQRGYFASFIHSNYLLNLKYFSSSTVLIVTKAPDLRQAVTTSILGVRGRRKVQNSIILAVQFDGAIGITR